MVEATRFPFVRASSGSNSSIKSPCRAPPCARTVRAISNAYTEGVPSDDLDVPPRPDQLGAPDRPAVRWLGHATTVIEIDGVRLLTDPVLLPQVTPLVHRRAVEAPTLDPAHRIDAVLISHAHHDHLDLRSLRLLPRDTLIVVPQGLGRWMTRRGFRHVEEMTVGRSITIGSVRVTATHAAHSGARLPFGPRALALGYLVQGSVAVYFAGDTEVFEGMREIPRALDTPLTTALLPVGGWGPTLRSGHMDPRHAAAALRLLHPAQAIPIHWGTYWPRGLARLRPERFHQPGATFAAESAEAAPGVRVDVLRPGESSFLADS